MASLGLPTICCQHLTVVEILVQLLGFQQQFSVLVLFLHQVDVASVAVS